MTRLKLEIYQGHKEQAVDNTQIGNFSVEIPQMPAKTADIRVTFEIDNDGILKVTAKEMTQETGEQLEI